MQHHVGQGDPENGVGQGVAGIVSTDPAEPRKQGRSWKDPHDPENGVALEGSISMTPKTG